uniref:helix-turn-helix transcriptional regulator n=1 Tax=Enterococcus faecalis TaxID=1351 RepID=UPI00359C4EF7
MIDKLENYKLIVKFLSQTLGNNYEIVLHWLDTNHSFYIAAIENGFISGRDLHSPITGFALNLINQKVYLEKDFVTNYKALSETNTLQGSTFFIKNEKQQLQGILCINFNLSNYIDIANKTLELANIDLSFLTEKKASPQSDITKEILHSSIEEIIYSTIDPSLLNKDIKLSKKRKLEICKKLQEKGIFKIKGAIPKVATILKISEPSVYHYLKLLNQ